MTIPQLFIPDKLVASHCSLPGLKPARSRSASFADSLSQVPRSITPLPPSSLQSSCTVAEDSQPTVSRSTTPLPPSSVQPSCSVPEESQPLTLSPEQESDPLPFATETTTTAPDPPGPPNCKPALQVARLLPSRASTPELDVFDSSASSDTSDESLADPRTSPSRARHVNPNIVSTTDDLYIFAYLFNCSCSHFLNTSLLHAHCFTLQTVNMVPNVNMATTIYLKTNITRPSERTLRRPLVLRGIEVRDFILHV